MWWIIGIALFITIALFCFVLIRGANMRRRNPEYGKQMDDEQEKILSQMKNNKE